jgi:hypothetical protein
LDVEEDVTHQDDKEERSRGETTTTIR